LSSIILPTLSLPSRHTLFFFHCSPPPPPLPSFPTRRSSDLTLAAFNAGPAALHDLENAFATILACFRAGRNSFASKLVRPRIDRSEEHTSELQSRGHLVCRLLLEKKKKKIKNMTSPEQHDRR